VKCAEDNIKISFVVGKFRAALNGVRSRSDGRGCCRGVSPLLLPKGLVFSLSPFSLNELLAAPPSSFSASTRLYPRCGLLSILLL
jgi:hypothetical protein